MAESVAVCGEALVDLVSTDGVHFTARPGGSPANVAVGLARLGVQACLLARISQDSFGRTLRAYLGANGVRLDQVVTATEPTTLAVASVGEDGSVQYEFRLTGSADWQWSYAELPSAFPPAVRVLHTGSMVLEMPPGDAVVERLLAREHARGQVALSYDPNVRLLRQLPAAQALARVERVVGLADVVKVSTEDLAWLLPGESPESVIRRWLALGTELVVVTCGAHGVVAGSAGAQVVRRPALPVVVQDTVGAGDAFTAGLLAALVHRDLLGGRRSGHLGQMHAQALGEVLDFAQAGAALTCTRVGADPPTAAEIDAMVR